MSYILIVSNSNYQRHLIALVRYCLSALLDSESELPIQVVTPAVLPTTFENPPLLVVGDVTDHKIIQQWWQQTPSIPAIVITARADVQSAVKAMQAGAIDYLLFADLQKDKKNTFANLVELYQNLTDYFEVAPLVAAVNRALKLHNTQNTLHHQIEHIIKELRDIEHIAYLRNVTPSVSPSLVGHAAAILPTPATNPQIRDLVIDLDALQALYRGKPLDLSPTEFDLLHHLVRANGQVVTFERLVQEVQGHTVERQTARKMLSAHISNLRSKLKRVGCEDYLANRRGMGYYIDHNVEEALHRVEAELRLIANNTQDIILHIDAEQCVRYISPSVEVILGYSVDEVIGTTLEFWGNFIHPNDLPSLQTLPEGQSTEKFLYRSQHRDGHFVWLEATSNRLTSLKGEFDGVIAIIRDVTDRIAQETENKQRQHQLTTLIDHSPDAIIRFDSNLRCIYANAAADLFFSYRCCDRALAVCWLEGNNPIIQRWQQALQLALQTGHSTPLEIELQDHDDMPRYFEIRNVAEYGDADTPTTILSIARDITDRVKNQRHIRDNEHFLRTIVNHIPLMIFRLDTQLRYLYVNPFIERVTHIPQAVFTGKTMREIGVKDHVIANWHEAIAQARETKTMSILHSDGKVAGIDTEYISYIVPEMDDQNEVISFIIITSDIQQQQTSEDGLRQLAMQLMETRTHDEGITQGDNEISVC